MCEVYRKVFGVEIPTRDTAHFERKPRAAAFGCDRTRRVLGWEPTCDWAQYVGEMPPDA